MYRWDPKFLTSIRKNPETNEDYRYAMASLLDFFNIFNGTKFSFLETLSQDSAFFDTVPDTIYFNKILISKELPKDNIVSYNTYLTIEDIMSLTNDFYKYLKEPFYTPFSIAFNKRRDRINILPNIFNSFYSANSITIGTNEYLMSVTNTNDFETLAIIIHEFAHIVSGQIVPYSKRASSQELIIEFESIFLELIAYDFFSKFKEFNNDSENVKISFFNSLIEEIELMQKKILVTSAYNELVSDNHYQIKSKDMLNDLASLTYLGRQEILTSASCIARVNAEYYYGNLIALELYHIFQNDPDKAINYYKRILELTESSEVLELSKLDKMGIHLTNHFDDYSRTLKK